MGLRDVLLILAIPVGIVLVTFAIKLAIFLVGWKQELDYIKAEYSRSTGGEHIHWEHEKRRQWRKIFPFLKKVEGDKEREQARSLHGGSHSHSESSHHS